MRTEALLDSVLGTLAIAACWAIGMLLVWLTGAPFPGSLVGMALLAGALRAGWIAERWVRRPATALIRWMPLFFVPAGVALLDQRALAAQWPAVVAGAVASVIAVLAVVGWLHQRLAAHD